jgi:hypothetical protein
MQLVVVAVLEVVPFHRRHREQEAEKACHRHPCSLQIYRRHHYHCHPQQRMLQEKTPTCFARGVDDSTGPATVTTESPLKRPLLEVASLECNTDHKFPAVDPAAHATIKEAIGAQ